MSFSAKNANSLNTCLAAAIAMIDIEYGVHELRYPIKRGLRQIEFRRRVERFADSRLFHDFLASARHHGGEIFGHDFISLTFEPNATVLHPYRSVREAPHGFQIMRDKNDRCAALF